MLFREKLVFVNTTHSRIWKNIKGQVNITSWDMFMIERRGAGGVMHIKVEGEKTWCVTGQAKTRP
jgi:hypothetical protein